MLARIERACAPNLAALRDAVRCLAALDVLQAFATAASEASVSSGPMCRPKFVDEHERGGSLLMCRGMRHPCLAETALLGSGSAPVPNDVILDGAADAQHAPFALLTGANMGGTCGFFCFRWIGALTKLVR